MTAGPDERTMHVIHGGGPETEDEAEQRIREDLHRMNVGPGGPSSSPPPMPAHPPAVPARQPAADADQEPEELPGQSAAPTRTDRLAPRWHSDRPDLSKHDDAEDEAEDAEDQGADDEDDDGDDGGNQRRGVGKSYRGRRVFKGTTSKGGTPHWSRPTLGRPPGIPVMKHNVFTWWSRLERHHKWAIYHGTGLGAGLYFHIPSFGIRGHEFIAHTPASEPEVWATWGLLGLLLVADYRARNWFPLLAWAIRALSTSVIAGALWYGAPLTH